MHCYTNYVVQVIYIESSGKTSSPLGDRYLSALIAQRIARCKRKIPGSNSTVGKNFSSCNFRFALITGHTLDW